jgi:uncharacterized protein YbbC (DUF1343 family)
LELEFKVGLEAIEQNLALDLSKSRVGLVANRTGISSNLTYTLDYLRNNYDIKTKALFAPEHGFYIAQQAGESVSSQYDERLGMKIFSIYQHTEESKNSKLSIKSGGKESAHGKDTLSDQGKTLPDDIVSELDVILFDTQDVGTRAYTQLGSMYNAMVSCAKHNIRFVILDRPDPINGITVQGPILDYPQNRSFVGIYSIPMRHGMTMGEIASMINEEVYHGRIELTVCRMKNWKRDMWFDDTHFPWVIPSPNMPTLDTTTVYPGQVLFEGTNLSEGRGTTKPFEIIGAPWIESFDFASEINDLNIPGVRVIEMKFTPTFSKYSGEKCNGIEIVVSDRNIFDAFRFSVRVIEHLQRKYENDFRFKTEAFDRLAGGSFVRNAVSNGEAKNLFERTSREDEAFENRRKNFLLYD